MTIITIKDPIAKSNVVVSIKSSEDISGGVYHVVSYEAKTSAEVDCTFAVIEYDEGNMVCQNDWQGAVVGVDEIADCEWMDCTPDDSDEREEYSITEAAEMLGVSRQRVHVLLQNGQLEGRKVGNAWNISRESIERRMK